MKPVRQQDGWIVVQAMPGSACAMAGMPGEEVVLTNVNGFDVSPATCPSITENGKHSVAATNGVVSWAGSVVPLVEECETCVFTFF